MVLMEIKLPKSIYILWLRLAWIMRIRFRIKTYGIGWTATKVSKAFNFKFYGATFRFIPTAARSYCLLPAGIANEPETHIFLSRILAYAPKGGVTFIDIGASIGEFAIPMAHHVNVERVIAYEPHPSTATALLASADLVPRNNIEVIVKGVGEKNGFATFDLNEVAPTGAGLRQSDDDKSLAQIQLCTLDESTAVLPGTPLLILIDIEGGELKALRGGQKLIDREKPLIIIEYNDTSRRFFQLTHVQDLLGDSYKIYRLRSEDGYLDNDLTSTWNVVAIPQQGVWQNLNRQPELFLK